MLLIMSLFFLLVIIEIVYIYMSPQIKKSGFGLYKYFRVASNHFINWLKSSDGAMYKANLLKLVDLISSSTIQTSKVYSVE
jgi:hypothetical protein